MRITTKGRYALRAVLTLAECCEGKPVSIRELAEKESISPEFLEQIFFKLKKTGMISSTRGPGGGFTLNRSPKDITLHDILDATGEGVEFSPCLVSTNGSSCPRQSHCIAHGVWDDAAKHIRDYFENITLKNILENKEEYLAKA
ncbi:MAG: RrF2 family transcriptional regulator [Spirochaetia bacterium]